MAHKALLVVRDDKKLLPLCKDKKILVIEQIIPYSFLGKDLYSHPHMFCEQMAKHSINLILDDTASTPPTRRWKRRCSWPRRRTWSS